MYYWAPSLGDSARIPYSTIRQYNAVVPSQNCIYIYRIPEIFTVTKSMQDPKVSTAHDGLRVPSVYIQKQRGSFKTESQNPEDENSEEVPNDDAGYPSAKIAMNIVSVGFN